MKNSPHKASSQEGFAAIVIAIILVIVLSLVTLGFAQLMRDEEKSALDRHLSNQAQYAAESGINDASKAVNAGFKDIKSDCGPLANGDTRPGAEFLKSGKQQVGNDAGIRYTCLLIDPAPLTLEYGAIDFNSSRVIKISGVDPDNISQPVLIREIVIGWQDLDGGQEFVPGAGRQFRPSGSWTYAGVPRLTLTPMASGFINRTNLIEGTYNAFLYPNEAANQTAPATYSHASGLGLAGGNIVDGNCHKDNQPRYCNVKINDLGHANYLLTLRSIYRKSRVTIQAYGFDGRQLRIKNAQTVLDSTGKAQDVVKRLHARISSHNNYTHTDFSIETTGSICKQLQLYPDSGSNACSP